MKHDERGLVPVDGTHAGWRGGSRPEVREISVNGSRHLIEGDSVDHAQLVRLAYPQIRAEEGRSLTVSYRGGPLHAGEGLLTPDQRKPVAQGETFVVARTVAS